MKLVPSGLDLTHTDGAPSPVLLGTGDRPCGLGSEGKGHGTIRTKKDSKARCACVKRNILYFSFA